MEVLVNTFLFFNTSIDVKSTYYEYTPSVGDKMIKWGEWCLTPVRYFFDGDRVTVTRNQYKLFPEHIKEFPQKATIARVIGFALAFFPGLVVGSVLKGVGLAADYVKENYAWLAAELRDESYDFGALSAPKRYECVQAHYRPVPPGWKVIGEAERPIVQEEIYDQLHQYGLFCDMNRLIDELTIHAAPGVTIKAIPFFIEVNAKRIYLMNAKYEKSDEGKKRISGTEERNRAAVGEFSPATIAANSFEEKPLRFATLAEARAHQPEPGKKYIYEIISK